MTLTQSFVLFSRAYAKTIDRPFELRYDPLTQSMEVLDNPEVISKVIAEVRDQLACVSGALKKMQPSSL